MALAGPSVFVGDVARFGPTTSKLVEPSVVDSVDPTEGRFERMKVIVAVRPAH
jgi:hypothetical protein